MGLWLILLICCSGVFGAGVLIWWRLDDESRRKRAVETIRAVTDVGEPTVTATVLLPPPLKRKGLGGLFQPASKSDGTELKGARSKGALILLSVGLALAGFMLGTLFEGFIGPAARVIGAAALGSQPWFFLNRRHNKRLLALEDQFPDALDFLARSLRAGHAFSIGMELLAGETQDPLKSEILIVNREMALGASLEDALHRLMQRVPLVEVRFFVSAVLLQKETGGNLSEILGKLSNSVRERMRLRSHVKAASGQGRLTAIVLSVLPVATLLMLRIMSPEYMSAMTDDPMGRNFLAVAVVSQVIGYFVMKSIINIEV